MRLQGLRRKYQALLGDRFDLREHYLHVSKDGQRPFGVPAAELDRWAAAPATPVS